jgi:hypothetical protein
MGVVEAVRAILESWGMLSVAVSVFLDYVNVLV